MHNSENSSKTKIIASTNVFQIEKVEKVGREDYPQLIEISLHLAKEYGRQAVLTKDTIQKYFNTEKSLPFIARYQDEIIGYIIGIPLEELRQESWAVNDENFGKYNTLYTYAFVIMEKYKSNGYARMLKRVYLSWSQKRSNIKYVTGHVVTGTSNVADKNMTIISRIDDWQGTKKSFEYYRRSFDIKDNVESINSPPLEITI
ncbi:GNAT family N-acetyltransferase [Candidatus Marinimicrobia bacterium]|nr:GNAT family N-acetyltransferase [Candidatus Neomarinimicrobiota bacterium]MDA7685682.1 GNAT family N-acetyltransferase [Candidatus Neomarinimicrobiota bacterium]MDB3883443.1 GNAT family N-acetyltransferase [Candidatus Neomarinimicrobiota bacterium]MDB3980341.1 GNAT family N-acetyltransferase [Candidatus Neomarinimicrobiota bacterium]MDC1000705.1 GNAT family N-acetyltransferase [Candidatus Neomarinimicrobiota bacterium]|tara:strand:- start:216 stop:821 length:606 start_codon:yes stop_codon:yes gene_type:complete